MCSSDLSQITTDLQHLAPVKFNINLQTSSTILSDKFRLITILKNTISNAVKYRKQNQDDCFVNINVAEENKFIVIRVEDNGIGISEKSLPKIFDMFYRATSSVAGTGLGLYICKEMITKLGGTISIDSKLGEGTTVTIRIPSH